MDFKNLLVEKREDGICIVTVNREKALNALNGEVLDDLELAFDSIEKDDAVRVVILTGAGRSFVAGADIAQMAPMSAAEGYQWAKKAMDIFFKIERNAKPVIAAINGFCLGGGSELALACDIRIASSKAKIGQPETGLGITPGFGGTQRLIRTVGSGMAKEIIYTAEMIKADEALRIGFVNHVYEPEKLMEEAINLASKIAKNSASAVQYAKSAINYGVQADIDTAMEIERAEFGLCFATHDQEEGMKAFLEKRSPEFE